MRQILALFSLLGTAAAMASAQPPRVRPRIETTISGSPDLQVAAGRDSASFTRVQLQAIERRFAAQREYLLTIAAEPDALLRAGLAEETDVLQQARGTALGEIGPTHVGLLTRPASPPRVRVDPALVGGLESRLRVQLGRQPSAAEVTSAVRAFDTRIARVNDELAARRTEIGRKMRRGEAFPRDLERRILGIPGRDAQTDSEQAEKGFQTLVRTLLLVE